MVDVEYGKDKWIQQLKSGAFYMSKEDENMAVPETFLLSLDNYLSIYPVATCFLVS